MRQTENVSGKTETSSSSPSDAPCFRCADVFFAFPHVSVGETGEVGSLLRRGRGQPSSACGALIAIRNGAKDGADTPLDQDDLEFGTLKRKVLVQVRAATYGSGDGEGVQVKGRGIGTLFEHGFEWEEEEACRQCWEDSSEDQHISSCSASPARLPAGVDLTS